MREWIEKNYITKHSFDKYNKFIRSNIDVGMDDGEAVVCAKTHEQCGNLSLYSDIEIYKLQFEIKTQDIPSFSKDLNKLIKKYRKDI